jgi:PAS domain S-box-containing protein
MSSSSQSSDAKGLVTPVDPRASSPIIGTGEMAELVRGYDWSSTPLGPVESWSDTLVTAVNVLLASRHPMFLWWGPELIQFYNDGYRPSIRADKHPSAIGQRGMECWPEIWPIIGPQIDAVMSQGVSTWNTNQLVPINRNGKLEEVYWTYSYSPVRDKDGSVKGTLVVCSETTEQVLSERRLRALLAVTADSPAQHQVPESETLLTFGKSIVRKLNDDPADFPFAALYLLKQEDILQAGSTACAAAIADPAHWPLAKVVKSQSAQVVDDLPTRFGKFVCQPWPEPVTRAYVLPLSMPGSSTQAALVFGISPRLPFDESYRTFLHLVGARIAGLLQSEVHKLDLAQAARRFRRLVEANPFGMVIGGLRGDLNYANLTLLETLGYSAADVASGNVRWDNLTPPEYAQADARAVEQLRATGRCDVYEKVYIAKDGRHVPILVGASVIDPSQDDPDIAAFVTDLTPLKTAQEDLRRANDDLEKKVRERTTELEAEILERERAETRLRQLTGRLLLAQDEERRHMARELHDHAGQTLVVLAMSLSELQEAAKNQNKEILHLASGCLQISDDLSKEIRTLSYLLHPPLLDEAGIASALRWYVDGFSQRSRIKVDLNLPEDFGRLPGEIELVIFRVVQESLTNVHRHSGSASACISLHRSENTVEFEISDQGKGITPEKQQDMATARIGVGVRGMEERVRQFKGTLTIASSDHGTKVTGIIPLASDAA